jgi:uncharacterized membrane protein
MSLFPRLSNLNTDRLAAPAMGILIVCSAVRNLVAAARKPLWYDEVLTWAISRQPNLRAIWHALALPADGQPPLFYVIERFASHLTHNEEVAYRLPSIAAFCCILWCVFVFMRRQSGPTIAFVCTALLMMTSLYKTYAIEARPYCLVAACFALAFVCYQRAARLGWVLLLAVSLMAAQSFHYYAVLGVAAFGVAEAVLLLRERRVRWVVWIALAMGCLPLVITWPLLSRTREYYGPHFWSPPTVRGTMAFYGRFFDVSLELGLAIAGALFLGLLCIVAFEISGAQPHNPTKEAPLHEYVLVLMFFALPAMGFITAKVGHGGLTDRYVLMSVLGFPLALAYLLQHFRANAFLLVATFLFCGIAAWEVFFWKVQSREEGQTVSVSRQAETFVDSVGYGNLPVVVATDYLQMERYASPKWKERLFAVYDVPLAVEFGGSDSVDAALPIIGECLPLQISDFHEFTFQHPDFLILYWPNAAGEFQTWLARLTGEGYEVRLLRISGGDAVYLAHVPKIVRQ